jgi:hypothetical protein
MIMAGFIHFDCLCGFDVYFFGDLASGEVPVEAIDILRARLGNHRYAIFTSRDNPIVPCPCCESMIQLPSPQIAEYLGQLSLANTNCGTEEPAIRGNLNARHSKKYSDGYNLQLPELN